MLSPLYDRWIREGFPSELPPERHATCDTCAMCATTRSSSVAHFRPDTKCCTFVPQLANFAVGGVLRDKCTDGREGKQSLVERMSRAKLKTPLGLMVDPIARHVYELGAAEAFGRSEALRCPHYSNAGGGTCGIWRHRNAVCSTWFCKHERGAVGKRFWDSLRDLLGLVEDHLSVWCALELGVPDRGVAKAIDLRCEPARTQIGRQLLSSDFAQASLWGHWLGREKDFYERCAGLVDSVRWPQVMQICGATSRALEGVVKENLATVSIHQSVRQPNLVTCQVSRDSEAWLRLSTYSPNDPLIVPKELPYLLHYFDGSSIEQILSRIKEEEEVDFDVSLIERLTDFGVLRDDGVTEPGVATGMGDSRNPGM